MLDERMKFLILQFYDDVTKGDERAQRKSIRLRVEYRGLTALGIWHNKRTGTLHWDPACDACRSQRDILALHVNADLEKLGGCAVVRSAEGEPIEVGFVGGTARAIYDGRIRGTSVAHAFSFAQQRRWPYEKMNQQQFGAYRSGRERDRFKDREDISEVLGKLGSRDPRQLSLSDYRDYVNRYLPGDSRGSRIAKWDDDSVVREASTFSEEVLRQLRKAIRRGDLLVLDYRFPTDEK